MTYYPIVIEAEASGAFSAYVPGLPVYAAADTRAAVERAIRSTLAAYLAAHQEATPTTSVRVARVSTDRKVALVSVSALMGARQSPRKALAARRNGKLGGRPRKNASRPT